MSNNPPPEYNNLPDYLNPRRLEITRGSIDERVAELAQSGRFETLHEQTSSIEITGASVAKREGKPNEDAMFAFIAPHEQFFCAGVFDGIGGQMAGEKASHMAADKIQTHLQRVSEPRLSVIINALDKALAEAREKIEPLGGDTTMTLIFGLPAHIPGPQGELGWEVFMVHVGDSRAYMQNDEGKLTQLSQDMGPVGYRDDISKLEAKVHNRRNEIYYSLLHPEDSPNDHPAAKTFPYRITPLPITNAYGPIALRLASDGYTDNFREDEKLDEINNHYADGFTPKQLIAAATLRAESDIKRLSKKDDTTVLDIKISPITDNAQNPKTPERSRKIIIPIPRKESGDIKLRAQNAWDKIQSDKQLRGLIARLGPIKNFEERDNLTLTDIINFLTLYPNPQDFKSLDDDINNFLNEVKELNGMAKKNTYERKLIQLKNILYGV